MKSFVDYSASPGVFHLSFIAVGEGDAQAVVAFPQCRLRLLHREPKVPGVHHESVLHQLQDTKHWNALLGGAVVGQASSQSFISPKKIGRKNPQKKAKIAKPDNLTNTVVFHFQVAVHLDI